MNPIKFAIPFLIATAALAEPIVWEKPIGDLRTTIRSQNFSQANQEWQLADIEADRASAQAQVDLEQEIHALNVWTATLGMSIQANTDAIAAMATSVQALADSIAATGTQQTNQRVLRAAIALEDVVALFARGWSADGSVPPTNINTSPWTELIKVPGIGLSVAMEIVMNRPHGSVDDLLRLPSIEQELLDQIKPYLLP